MLTVNREKLDEYFAERYSGADKGTINVNKCHLRHLLDTINKPIMEITKLDLITYFNKLYSGEIKSGKGKTMQPYTIEQRKTAVKTFFRWVYGWERGDKDPELIRWIRSNHKVVPQLSPSDMLSRDEVMLLIEGFYTNRDKALFAMQYDTGTRISELLDLKLKDLVQNNGSSFIVVREKDCKTKVLRQVPLNFCVPFLQQYLSTHPDRSNPDEYVFLSKNGKYIANSTQVNVLLKLCAKRVGLNKKVHTHILRHSRFSEMARKGANEMILRKMGGWSPTSQIPSHYVHLSSDDIRDAMMKTDSNLTSIEQQIDYGVEQRMQKERDAIIKQATMSVIDKIQRGELVVSMIKKKKKKLDKGHSR